MTQPEQVETVRRYGILVSDDGFISTPTGPVHALDCELGRALLTHDRLAEAARYAIWKLEALCRAGKTQPGMAEKLLRECLADEVGH